MYTKHSPSCRAELSVFTGYTLASAPSHFDIEKEHLIDMLIGIMEFYRYVTAKYSILK